MTPRHRIERLLAGKPVDRTPFCPAVYEHKAALVGVTPSELCRDVGLLVQGLLREVELYDNDMPVVGCDVYNVEAEAAGCVLDYPDSNGVPSIKRHVLEPGQRFSSLYLPNPEKDGRMPLHLEAGRRVHARIGKDRIVLGALTAPYSLACSLTGTENILLGMRDDPDWVADLLQIAAKITMAYARSYVQRGLGVVLFDSYAAPPLLSPSLFDSFVRPVVTQVIQFFRSGLELHHYPYIVGGNTALILDEILATGTNGIICDYNADLELFMKKLVSRPVLLRANMNPAFIRKEKPAAIRERASEILRQARGYPRFLLGTSILAYDTPTENVLAVREAIGGPRKRP